MKVGTLVKIREGTNDEQLPDHRVGLVVEVEVHRNNQAVELIYHVQFSNGKNLTFFEEFVEIVSEPK